MARRSNRNRPREPDLSPDEQHALRLYAVGVPLGRSQHDHLILEETMQAGQKRARVMTECVIDQYRHRSQINDRVWMAGMQLRKMWMRAVYPAATTGSYGEQRGNGDGPGANIDARHVLMSALESAGLARRFLPGTLSLTLTTTDAEIWMERYPSTLTLGGHIAIDVCGMDNWAGGTQRLVLLREALSSLATYWKISGDEEVKNGQMHG